jgi:hypothetical protein
MSLLSTTYLEDLPNLDRYGSLDDDAPIQVHVANCYYEIIHIGFDNPDNSFEVNMTIENAEAILAGLAKAIQWAKKGRNND